MANGEGSKIPVKFLCYIIGTLIALGIAWGTLRSDVTTNGENIKKAESARIEMKADFTKAMDKLIITADKTNENLVKLEKQVDGFTTELKYIRRERIQRNRDE
jgi:hypothetical protein